MADIQSLLVEAMNGTAPQHKLPGQDAFEATEGSGGNLHVKDNLVFQKVEELRALIEAQETKTQSVKDTEVITKLGLLESKIQATNDRLNQTLETNLNNTSLDVNVLNQPEPYSPRLQEQLSETDAVAGTLTFLDVLKEVEIYNRDVNDGVFTINNLAITVPADTSFQAEVGGTPGNTVNVTGSASYIVGRYA